MKSFFRKGIALVLFTVLLFTSSFFALASDTDVIEPFTGSDPEAVSEETDGITDHADDLDEAINAVDDQTGASAIEPEVAEESSKPSAILKEEIAPEEEIIAQELPQVPVYRLYNPRTGEHLYTTSILERDSLTFKSGWNYEGIGWFAPSAGEPVYRLYNPRSGQHLFTKDTNEVNVLTSRGWKKDNGGNPLFYSGGDVDIYRLFNRAKTVGSHHWTTDANEYNVLPTMGWQQENVAFKAAAKGQTVKTGTGTVSATAIFADASKDKEKTFALHADGVEMSGDISKIQFAVWSTDKGQDDVKWYDGAYGGGKYNASAVIKNHKSPGKYLVHAYGKMKNGKATYLGSTSFTVSGPSGEVLTNDVNGQKGTFGIIGRNLQSVSGVSKVEYAVWCHNDQSDIKWYTASRASDGNYIMVANVGFHKHHFGTYKVHMYVTMGNGIRAYVDAATASISPNNYIYATKLNSEGTQYVLTVVNANYKGTPATKVQLPTWSNTGGKDDVVWYVAQKKTATDWQVTVDSAKHKHGGKYTVHGYVNDKYIGDATFNMNYDQERINMLNRVQGLTSPTNKLIAVNTATHRVGVYYGSKGNWKEVKYWPCGNGTIHDPTPKGLYNVNAKGSHFFTVQGYRCWHFTQFHGTYLFHSVLYNNAGTEIVDGRLGVAVSHGCVRLAKENALWIQNNVNAPSLVYVY